MATITSNKKKYGQPVITAATGNTETQKQPVITAAQSNQSIIKLPNHAKQYNLNGTKKIPITVSITNNNILNTGTKNIINKNLQEDISKTIVTGVPQKDTKIDLSGKSYFQDTGKTYGDYYYDNYTENKDKKILLNTKDKKYYVETNGKYQPLGTLDKNGNVYNNRPEIDKNNLVGSFSKYKKEEEKQLNEAKKAGYKENKTKITTQDYDNAQAAFKSLKKAYKLTDSELQEFIDTGVLNMSHISIATNDIDEVRQQAIKYREKLQKGAIKQNSNNELTPTQQIYLDTSNMSETDKSQYINFLSGKYTPQVYGEGEEGKWFKASDVFKDGYDPGDILKTIGGTLGNIGLSTTSGIGNWVENTSDFLTNALGSGLEIAFGGDKKQETKKMNGKTLLGYKYGNKKLWYDKSTNTLYDDSGNIISQFNLNALKKNENFTNDLARFGTFAKDEVNNSNEMTDAIMNNSISKKIRGASVLGNKSEEALQSMGESLPTMAMGMATNSTAVNNSLIFSTSYAREKANAIQQGYDETNSRRRALSGAIAETVSENFFEGVQGVKVAGWGERLVNNISGGIERYLGSRAGKITNRLLNISGEGFEELISNALNAANNDFIAHFYTDYDLGNQSGNMLEDIRKELTSKESWEAFMSAMITSAILNSGQVAINSQQQQQIIEAFAEDNNLTFKEAKQVLLNREYSIIDQKLKENDGQQEQTSQNNVQNIPVSNKTQQDNTINQVQQNSPKKLSKKEIKTIVEEVNNQQEKKLSQTVDMPKSESKTNAPIVLKYQETDNQKINNFRKSAVKEKMINNRKTQEVMKIVENIISDKNYNVSFDSTITNKQGESVDGKISLNKNGETDIKLNPKSDRAVEFLITHEITHAIETQELRGLILNYAQKNSKFKQSLESLQKIYKTQDVSDEVVADISAQVLGNQEFINSLLEQNTQQNKNIIIKLYEVIKKLLNILTSEGRYRNFVQDLETKWRDAYRIATNKTTQRNLSNNTQYLKGRLTTGEDVVISDDINGNRPNSKDVEKTLKGMLGIKYINKSNNNEISIENKDIKKYLNDGYNNYKNSKLKKRIAGNYGEIIELAKIDSTQPNYKNSNRGKQGYDYYNVNLSYPIRDSKGNITDYKHYEARLVVRKDNNNNFAYDLDKFKEKKGAALDKSSLSITAEKSASSSFSKNNISRTNKNVKSDISIKYSIQENQNNTQKEQISLSRAKQRFKNNIYKYGLGSAFEDSILYYNLQADEIDLLYEYAKKTQEYNETQSNKVQIDNVYKNYKGETTSTQRYSKKTETWQEHLESNYISSGTRTYFDEIKAPISEDLKSRVIKDKVKSKKNNNGLKSARTAAKIAQNKMDLSNNEKNEFRKELMKYKGYTKEKLTNAKTYNEIKDIVKKYSDREISYINREIQDVKDYIKNTKLEVTQELKNSITDYNDFRKSNFGKLKLSNEGMSIDSFYEELSQTYPGYFSNEIDTDEDRLYAIADFMNEDSTITEKYSLDDKTIDDITAKVFNTLQENAFSKEQIEQFEKEISDRMSKITRKSVREMFQKQMGITAEQLATGKDITSVNYQLTDPIRVNEKVFGRELGNKINDETIRKETHNEARKIRWFNRERNDIKELGIKPRSKESAAVQKYGEKQFLNDNGELVKYGDKELRVEFPNEKTQEKIKRAAEVIRNKYDKYIDQINETLTSLGYDAIPKRADYMRHFQELGDIFSKTGVPFNLNDMRAEDLPTDINGLTEFNRPGKNYFASAQKRIGQKTTYDAITGIDGYLEGAGNLIYHTADIQRYRALSSLIRDSFGSSKGFDNLGNLTDAQAEQRVNDILDNKLSRYAAWLDEQANNLAGKKGAIDRGVERFLGRKVYTGLNTIKKQVGSNMTGFNVRSALTNLISSTIASAKTNKLAFVKGTASTIRNMFKNDGFIDKSDFLTTRFGSDQLSKKIWQKASNAGQIFMTGTDYFTANQITRSKYYEGLQKGLSESEAIKYADDFASRVMGDRSLGRTAEAFNSKTLGLLTQFQLEVNNQWQYMIHDTVMDYQKNSQINGGLKAGATALFQMGQLAAFSYFFNEVFEALTGSRAAFDPIDILKKLFGSDDDEDKPLDERIFEANKELFDNIPFGNLFTGGGRIPISEAFKGTSTFAKKMTGQKNQYGGDITWEDVGTDVLGSLPYYLLPTGYSQAKKTTKGLSMFSKDKEIKGSYTKSGRLRFPVKDTAANRIQAGLFGEYSSSEARKYFDQNRSALTENQQNMYKTLKMPISDYWEINKEINSIKKELNGKDISTNERKEKYFDYIDSLDVSSIKKSILKKSLYKSYHDEDYEIEEYINSSNMSKQSKKDILEKLGLD